MGIPFFVFLAGFVAFAAEEPALLRAAADGRLAEVRSLLAAGADANAVGADQETALLLAARGGHHEVIEALLAAGARPDARRWNGETALHAAAASGAASAVELLAAHFPDRNPRESRRGQTPLHYAAGAGSVEVIRVLLKAGADVNARSAGGATALWHAAQGAHAPAVDLLLASGADPELRGPEESRPVQFAVRACRPALLEPFLKARVDLNSPNAAGMSLLHIAVAQDCVPLAKQLIAAGADASAKDRRGATPLDHARRRRMAAFIQLFEGIPQ